MTKIILQAMPSELILSAANRINAAYTKSGGDDKNASCKELVVKLRNAVDRTQVYMSQKVKPVNLRKEDMARVEAAKLLIYAVRGSKYSPTAQVATATQTLMDETGMDNIKLSIFGRGYARKGAVIDNMLASLDSESLGSVLEALPEVQALAEKLRAAQNAFLDAQYKKVATLNAIKEQKRKNVLACLEIINDIVHVAKAMQPDSDFTLQVNDTVKWARSEYKAGIKHEGDKTDKDNGKGTSDTTDDTTGNEDTGTTSGSNAGSESGSDGGENSGGTSDNGSDGGADTGGGDDGDDTVDK